MSTSQYPLSVLSMLPEDDSQDTEFLLSVIASLLPSSSRVSRSVLLHALLEADGDVNAAAQSVTSNDKSAASSGSTKRKRDGSIDDWLSPSKLAKLPTLRGSSSQASSRPTTSSLQETAPPKLRPMTLSLPATVSKYTPMTLHESILPAGLACQLYYAMLDEAKTWHRNKWYIVDKLVESPHKTTFYVRSSSGDGAWDEAAKYWCVDATTRCYHLLNLGCRYNGRVCAPPSRFPPELEEACSYVEEVVNSAIDKRPRFPLEWAANGPHWKANVAAANCYTGSKEGVGFHADQMTCDLDLPLSASLR